MDFANELQARVVRANDALRRFIAPQPFQVGGRITATGVAELWAGNTEGLAQTAQVHFE